MLEYNAQTGNATTNCTYDTMNRLTDIGDAVGNQTHTTYDLGGRKTGSIDPDTGTWSFGYDPIGKQTSQVDARGQVVLTDYDALHRPTDTSGDLAKTVHLSHATYDAPGQLGLAHDATSYDQSGNAYTQTALAYDTKNRPTSSQVTVPNSATGLAGTYVFGAAYDLAGHQKSVTLPGGPNGSAGETVTAGFSNAGIAATLTSPSGTYVNGSTYNSQGLLTGQTLGGPTPLALTRALTYEPITNRLLTLKAGAATNTISR